MSVSDLRSQIQPDSGSRRLYALSKLSSETASAERNGASVGKTENKATSTILRGLRSVIAEDEGITQLQLRRILRMEGVEVVGLASNGAEAVKLVRQHRPDFVLMDIRMPGMDGMEASRRILEDGPLCIIVLTAFSDDEYKQEAMDVGASGYIIKPIISEMLVPQIEAALRRFREPRQ